MRSALAIVWAGAVAPPAVVDADRSLPVPASPHDWLAERKFALDEGLHRVATCRPTFNVKTLSVGFRPLPQTTRYGRRAARSSLASAIRSRAPPVESGRRLVVPLLAVAHGELAVHAGRRGGPLRLVVAT